MNQSFDVYEATIATDKNLETIEKDLRLAVTDSVFSEHYLVVDAVKTDGSLIQKMLRRM